MEPEEKHAARLIKKHKIVPPYNLEELVSLYAEIEISCAKDDIVQTTISMIRDNEHTGEYSVCQINNFCR